MKKFTGMLIPGVLALAVLSLLGPFSFQGPFPDRRTFEVTYEASLDPLPDQTGEIRVWIPLAGDREGQKILERSVTAPGPYRITEDPVFGNEMIYFKAQAPFSRVLDFKIQYRVEVAKEDFLKRSRPDRAVDLYLKPASQMKVTEEIERRAVEATRERKGGFDKARAIYEDVIHRMSYDKVTPGWGEGNSVRACLLGKGNCTDFHSLFISMAHAAEIPARFKIGFTVPGGTEGEIPGYHCWAEFFEPEKGWRPVDASEAWKRPDRKEAYFGRFDTNKFLVSVGRDIELVPRQAGPPVNIFFYPVVEVDGKESKEFRTRFDYRNLKQ